MMKYCMKSVQIRSFFWSVFGHFPHSERKNLVDSLHGIKTSILKFQDDFLTNILLFSSMKREETVNKKILQSTVTYLKLTNRFERPLIDQLHSLV